MGPTGPDQTRVFDKVRGLCLVGSGRARVVEFSCNTAFGGTGLCFYRVRGVDGSCAERLTVESYTIIIYQQSTYLLLFGIPSPTHYFIARIKPSFLCKSFPPQPFLFLFQDSLHRFPRLFTVISEHIFFYFLVFLF